MKGNATVRWAAVPLAALLGLFGTTGLAAQKDTVQHPARDSARMHQAAMKPGDNTQRNKQAGMTADNQGGGKSDLEITRSIRKAVLRDKSISTYGHNAKIITKHGMVTLRGPVRTEAEKEAIARYATSVAGDAKVKNELEVVPKK